MLSWAAPVRVHINSQEGTDALPARCVSAVIGPDRRVYAIGGWDGQAVVSSVEAYNPRTDSWTTVPDLPLPLAQEGAVVTRHRIVVLGGGDAAGNHTYGTLFVFNGHGWVGGSSMPSPRRALGAAVDAHGMIFAIAGLDNSSSYQSTVDVYNPFTNNWSSGPSLPEALQSPGVVSSGGHIYAIGGWNGAALSQVAVLAQPRAPGGRARASAHSDGRPGAARQSGTPDPGCINLDREL